MTTFVNTDQEPALHTEAAALALVATQAVTIGLVMARDVERQCFDACTQVTHRDLAELRYAAGELVSPELASSVQALRQATELREELEASMHQILGWCASVQVREAWKTSRDFTGPLQ
jgi:ectoine hydroxylase-related dioxygenase (phytanoyl-CoA dioxygenase family)